MDSNDVGQQFEGIAQPELSDEHKAMIDHEGLFYKHPGAKEDAIRKTFGIGYTRYYQVVNSLLDNPAALAYNPQVVNRLTRVRDARRTARNRRPS
jgi:hypothetical protein